MSHKDAKVSPNFGLSEFLPKGWDGSVPPEVLGNVIAIAENLLEPARAYVGRPVHVNSCWRLKARNEAVGGSKTSDHLEARAADIWADGAEGETWQDATIRLFHWMRTHLVGRFGQLILEDRRVAEQNDNALLIHVSLPTAKHPGTGADTSAVLVSHKLGHYQAFEEPHA